MNSRREFLKTSGLFCAGVLVAPKLFASMADKQYIGLQLYTVRDYIDKDAAATIAKVAEIGYTSVEGSYAAGKFNTVAPAQFKKLLKQNGLIMPSCHYRLGEEKIDGKTPDGTILSGWQKAVDDAAEIGQKYMVCAYLSEPERGDLDRYKKIADDFNKAAEICKKSGIQFCYHNHDFEFVQQDGKYPYEVLLANTDKDLVKMEMDLFWVTKANQDPIALINAHPGRFPLWHMKDMDKTSNRMFTEVGNGIIDFKKILTHASTSGLKYFFVEEDKCPGDPYDSIKMSYSYIKKNLVQG
jgi:sugar phosphate isomerase/epimerase